MDAYSYDYDAPLTECGDAGPKFKTFQDVIRKYRPDAPFAMPEPVKKQSIPKISLIGSAKLYENIDRLAPKKHSLNTLTMEQPGQSYGFINYRTHLSGPCTNTLYFPLVRDRVCAYLDGQYLGTVYRNDAKRKLSLSITGKQAILDLLVEKTGRINFGPQIGLDMKGLPHGVCVGLQKQIHFDYWNLELNDISPLHFGTFANDSQSPAFHRGLFNAEPGVDTFLQTPGVKGVVWINGFNIGRYWEIGPQKALYVPGPLLKERDNEIIILELHQLNGNTVDFIDHPQLS